MGRDSCWKSSCARHRPHRRWRRAAHSRQRSASARFPCRKRACHGPVDRRVAGGHPLLTGPSPARESPRGVSPPPADLAASVDGNSLWVSAAAVTSPDPLLLRSHLWEIPAGQEREFLLRKPEHRRGRDASPTAGRGVYLAREMAGTMALVVVIDVPLDTAPDYLWRLASACRHCRFRNVPWQPPRPVTASASLEPTSSNTTGRSDAARANAAHYANQLPLWLPTRQFWSVFQWRDGHLFHTLQFSLPEKLRRTLTRRFRLRQA